MAEGKTEVASEVSKSPSRPSHLCCYSQRVCNLDKLKGFDFCHKHILEDKASPFKPCDFYAKINDKRCMNPAPKLGDKEKSYCIIHTRKAELRRNVEKRKKKRQRGSSSTVEDDHEESIIDKRRRTSSSTSQKSIDGSQRGGDGSDDDLSTDLGLAGPLKVDSAWHGDVDSDAESVDSEEEDHLRHAGTWTVDEVTKMCCDKMTRLKSLYMAQYKRLFHVLKEKRRKYLQLVQVEQDNESGERYVSPSEILGKTTLCKHHGVEAILHKQAKEKRHGIRHTHSSHQRCCHVTDGVRCANKILPLTKFCIHHISHDPNQLLFHSCSFKTGEDKVCSNAVPKIYSYSTCQLHMSLTAEPTRSSVDKDLEEATKRDQEQKLSENIPTDVSGMSLPLLQEPDQQLPIPKALQQKSSALIPPLAAALTISSTAVNTPNTTHSTSTITPTKSKHFAVPNIKLEKMDVDSPALEGVTSRGSCDSTPMEVQSPVSGYSTPAGVKSISPTLLAASLVAVCSAAASPSVSSALETSSVRQSTSSGMNLEEGASTSTTSYSGVNKCGHTMNIPTSLDEVKFASTISTVGETSTFKRDNYASTSNKTPSEVDKSSTSAPIPREGDMTGSMSSTPSIANTSAEAIKSTVALAPASAEGDKSTNTSVATSTSLTSSSLSTSSSGPSPFDDKGSEAKTPTNESSITNTTANVPSNCESADPSTSTRTREQFTTESTTLSTTTDSVNVVQAEDLTNESQ